MGHVRSGHGQGSRLIIQSNHDKAFLSISFEFFFLLLIFDIGIFHVKSMVPKVLFDWKDNLNIAQKGYSLSVVMHRPWL